MNSGNKLNRGLVKWLLIGGAWTLVAFFFTSQLVTQSRATARPLPFLRVLGWELTSAYVWLAFLPLILWLGRRFRFEKKVWVRSLFVHLAASLLVALVQQGVDALVLPHLGYPPRQQFGSFLETYKFFLLLNYHLSVAIYWVVVGAQHAVGYYQMYRERELRASQLEAKLAHSRLQILKMQLHPHFLFNTLNTISELIYQAPEEAERMIADLSDLLRLSLENAGVQEVPLRQELDFLEKYLQIEQTRFHDRLRVRMEIDPQALDASVPNMILQPLVENAIRHGIAPLAAGGQVEIAAARENGSLRLRVSDDGRGLPVGGVATIKEGVGLSNTRARLSHLYGAAQRFDVQGAPDKGLTLTLTIPYRSHAAAEQHED
jgi:two-component system, LytTR family, sensor kinase